MNGTWDPLDELLTQKESIDQTASSLGYVLIPASREASLGGLTFNRLRIFVRLLPSEKPSLEPDDFLKALDSEGFRPLAVPAENFPELQVSLPGKTPAGVFEFEETMFAIYETRSTKDEAANDRNGTLEVYINANLMLVTNKKCNPKVIEAFQSLRPSLTYRQAGLFVYPLGLCLLIAVFVITERAYSLRRGLTFLARSRKP